jgi:hypothetical protein
MDELVDNPSRPEFVKLLKASLYQYKSYIWGTIVDDNLYISMSYENLPDGIRFKLNSHKITISEIHSTTAYHQAIKNIFDGEYLILTY